MANYHISKDKNLGQWRVKREGAERISGYYPNQAKAENVAKHLSATSGGGEVRIHSVKGPIRDSDTVAPGHDPDPPKDYKH